jgi:hypothetical protein
LTIHLIHYPSIGVIHHTKNPNRSNCCSIPKANHCPTCRGVLSQNIRLPIIIETPYIHDSQIFIHDHISEENNILHNIFD